MKKTAHRDTIHLETAEIISKQQFPGDQVIIRLHAPECAKHAVAGSFAHLQCHPQRLMRRPISIMRRSKKDGWVDFLFKILGEGTQLLAEREVGEKISLMGPIGKGFELKKEKTLPLLIGGGVGMPPMIFIADEIRQQPEHKPLVILGSEVPFPFTQATSKIPVKGVSETTNHSMPILEQWGIPSRLASLQNYTGCFQGYVTDLARQWLDQLSPDELAQVEIYSCGPHPMLAAVAKLAQDYNLPCQVSLEEFMACAVGGCAGCTVEVSTPTGLEMKRVCVDGPVFSAQDVFF